MTLLHGAAGTKVAILTVMAAAFQPRRPWVAIRAWTWKHVRASMDDLPMARESRRGWLSCSGLLPHKRRYCRLEEQNHLRESDKTIAAQPAAE